MAVPAKVAGLLLLAVLMSSVDGQGIPNATVCRLPKVVGPCEAAIRRWFFNTATGKCERFFYGGCFGNANNFNSLADCLNACDPSVLQCPNGTTTVNCLVDPCRFASCPGRPGAICISDFCGGCNARFFETNGCEVTTQCNTCRLPRVVGPCRAAFRRWFFNTTSEKCEQFIFGGCGGNKNNFNSLTSCLNTCDPSVLQCPPGDIVNCFVDPCQVASCPNNPGATCVSDFCRGCNARFFDANGREVTSTCCQIKAAISTH